MDHIERLARKWCEANGQNPDMEGTRVTIPCVETPSGLVNIPSEVVGSLTPLWVFYARQIKELVEIGIIKLDD